MSRARDFILRYMLYKWNQENDLPRIKCYKCSEPYIVYM